MATVSKQPAATRSDTRSAAPVAKPTSVPAAKPTSVGTLPTEKVAARAYEIWLASGRPNGKDLEHWYQAERELRGAPVSRSTSR